MNRAIVEACLPGLGLIVGAGVALALIARLSGARLELARIRGVHRDQQGAAQSLSFVLTLPIFVMVMVFIVQLVQVLIGTIVVHYAAFAAARTAIVWIPARLANEPENCISTRQLDPEATEQTSPNTDATATTYGPSTGGLTYRIAADLGATDSEKVRKVYSAAVLGCMPIASSRRGLDYSVPADLRIDPSALLSTLETAARDRSARSASDQPLRRKLAYAANHTRIEIQAYHQNESPEPPLLEEEYPCVWRVDTHRVWRNGQWHIWYTYHWRPFGEFKPNELGWQDAITVTVRHDLALTGPAWLMSGLSAMTPGGLSRVLGPVTKMGDLTTCTLTAQATLGLEGEKAVVPYVYY